MNPNPVAQVHISQGLGLIQVSPAEFNEAPREIIGLTGFKGETGDGADARTGVDTDGARAPDEDVGDPRVVNILGKNPQISPECQREALVEVGPERG